MKKIELTQGAVALVDDNDFDWLNQYTWCAACFSNLFYAVNGTVGLMHRFRTNRKRNSRRSYRWQYIK